MADENLLDWHPDPCAAEGGGRDDSGATVGMLGETLSGDDKGLPSRVQGLTVAEFLATNPSLSEFWTPLLALDAAALSHNVEVMARWCEARGFSLAPHGKTTMAPELWRGQVDAGAWAIALATPAQLRTARAHGFDSLLLANALTDPRGLAYVAGELDDPDFRFSCWADSIATVETMEHGLAGLALARRLDVSVELGIEGGRTGARGVAAARAVAERIAASPVLRLAGVAGYEGAVAHDRSEAGLAAVRAYLRSMLELHTSLAGGGAEPRLYDDGEALLSAGGSAFFDLVAEVFDPRVAPLPGTRYLLRSGAYITHDDGFYRGISPLEGARLPELAEGERLRPAMRAYARVLSNPEPGLALLDAGKRDLPYDEGLPTPFSIAPELGEAGLPLEGATITAMNDQHSYLRMPGLATAGGGASIVGSVVTLGISHPCTAFDKWRYLPVVADDERQTVVGLVRTYF